MAADSSQSGQDEGSYTLANSLLLIRKWRIVVLLTVIAVLVTVVLLEKRKPVYYTSSVEVTVFPLALSSELMATRPIVLKRQEDLRVPYFMDHASSAACIDEVIQSGIMGSVPPQGSTEWIRMFEGLVSKVSVDRIEARSAIRINIRSADPEFAVRLANVFGAAYTASLAEYLTSSTSKMEKFLDREIQETELELARYRNVINDLKRREEIVGDLERFESANARFEEVRKLLGEKAAAIPSLEEALASGTVADLEEIDVEISGIIAIVPQDLRNGLGGASRLQMERSYSAWSDDLRELKRLARTYTEHHPKFIKASVGAQESGGDLLKDLLIWSAAADKELKQQIDNSYRIAAVTSPEISSFLNGEPVQFDQQALERYGIELRIREALLEKLVTKKSEIRIQNSHGGELAEWTRPATDPPGKTGPDPLRASGYGLGLGLLAGCAMAFLMESLDRTLKHPQHAEMFLRRPVLAVIPRLPNVPRRAEGELFHNLASIVAPESSSSEAYLGLAHKLLNQDDRIIALTSTGPQEGKSTTAANLAVALSQLGKKVLLVSANLRRPTAHLFFGVAASPGLRDLVAGEYQFDELIKSTTIPRLSIIPPGSRQDGSVISTLSSERIVEFLAVARGKFDHIIVDLPPTGPVADSMALAPHVDAIYIVYMLGRAHENAVGAVIRSLEEAGGKVKGIIMNDVKNTGKSYGYGYGYGYDYGYQYSTEKA